MKKTIVCDVDGCILDFGKAFAEHWNNKYSKKIEANPEDWYFGILNRELLGEEIKYLVQTDKMRTLPYVFKDTEKYFNKLIKKYNVHIVSSFPEEKVGNRIHNLRHLKYNTIDCLFNKKIDFIINEIKPDIIIEDCPEYIERSYKANIPVYYPDRKYNRDCYRFGKIFFNWKDLYRLLTLL